MKTRKLECVCGVFSLCEVFFFIFILQTLSSVVVTSTPNGTFYSNFAFKSPSHVGISRSSLDHWPSARYSGKCDSREDIRWRYSSKLFPSFSLSRIILFFPTADPESPSRGLLRSMTATSKAPGLKIHNWHYQVLKLLSPGSLFLNFSLSLSRHRMKRLYFFMDTIFLWIGLSRNTDKCLLEQGIFIFILKESGFCVYVWKCNLFNCWVCGSLQIKLSLKSTFHILGIQHIWSLSYFRGQPANCFCIIRLNIPGSTFSELKLNVPSGCWNDWVCWVSNWLHTFY